jgi:hypothetical protein
LAPEGAMDILVNDKGFYLEQVPITMVWQDKPESSALSTIVIRKIGIRFANLNSKQKERIDYFIKNYTVGVA